MSSSIPSTYSSVFESRTVQKIIESCRKVQPANVLPTGLQQIDAILGGGIHSGIINEIYGPGGSGKTQLCLHLVANCLLEIEDAVICYVTTNSKTAFPAERLLEILSSKIENDENIGEN
eukprot:Trichotokara_eunicae@DN2975_c0_g1_i1.p1